MKVVCKRCGTEYEMPLIAKEVIMEDCPVCKDLDKTLEKMGLKDEGTRTSKFIQ